MKTQGKQAAAMIAAEEQGYSVIEITHGMNGYPERLGDYGITGFENFEAAETFTSEHGGTVAEFTRRDGWHFWQHLGRPIEGYTPQDFLKAAGDNYNIATNDPEEVSDRLTSFAERFAGDMDKLREQFADLAQLWEKVETAPDRHTVISYCGQYFDTLPPEMMNFRHDTHQYIIGVYLPKEMAE
jgi:hypothetical protein